VLTRELMDLPGDLGNENARVAVGSVPFKPDLASGAVSREDHLATLERQPQVAWAVNAHGTVTTGLEDV